MPDKREEDFSPPAVGAVSLLVVFAVLCLTVFALLSLTTVQADMRLADASVQAVAGYYAADCRAQELLARVLSGEEPEGVEITGSGTLTVKYAVPISDTQELRVSVLLTGRDGQGGWNYTIERWQAVPAGEWEPDESIEIWDGTLF